MRTIGISLAALAALVSATAADARVAEQKVFACSLGRKAVSVTTAGGRLNYRFGAPGKTELALTAGPGTGNVFFMRQRYHNIESQLRFTKGEFSYIVYEMGGDSRVDMHWVAGLVVMKGTKTVADMSCTRFTEFTVAYDLDSLPEDSETYSAM